METSIWEAETFVRKRDIIIIGAGFSGLWTALSLKEKFPKNSILVVERASFSQGASSRNAGFACFGSLTEVLSDFQKMGSEKTLSLVEMRFRGLQKIQEYFPATKIDFEYSGGYEIINNEKPLLEMEEVNSLLKEITKLEHTYIKVDDKIKEFGFANSKHLVLNPLEGGLHPGKLLQELMKKCREQEVEFLFGAEVIEVIEHLQKVEVFLKDGRQIYSEEVVYCTNAFSHRFFIKDIAPARGQVLLTSPIENLTISGTFHYDEGYYYFRNLGDRILLGGARNLDFENEETYNIGLSERIQNHLEKFLKEIILPKSTYTIERRWSGIMAMGNEKTPLIERLSQRQLCAVRLSGMGVALAPIVGEKITSLI